MWAVLKDVSNDKGPYHIGTVHADGKEMTVALFSPSGMNTNPLKGSLIFIMMPWGNGPGDHGRAVGLVMAPPKERVDQQKEGEATFIHHKDKQLIKLVDGGGINAQTTNNQIFEITSQGGLKINANVTINGNTTLEGDLSTTGGITSDGAHKAPFFDGPAASLGAGGIGAVSGGAPHEAPGV